MLVVAIRRSTGTNTVCNLRLRRLLATVQSARRQRAASAAAHHHHHRLTNSSRFRWFSNNVKVVTPILNCESLQQTLESLAPCIAASLETHGYWTNGTTDEDDEWDNETFVPLLPMEQIRAMREQSIALRSEGRFEPSWSERVVSNNELQRFDKEGVFACEPDGRDYDTAPDLVLYMSTLISTLPPLLNNHINRNNVCMDSDGDDGGGGDDSSSSTSSTTNTTSRRQHPLCLSNRAFNAKLAVTLAGGATYPLHVDNNNLGVVDDNDTRKLTCILYLNPDYEPGDGGELRLLLLDRQCLTVTPRGGRAVMFWSDEIPHEVLPTVALALLPPSLPVPLLLNGGDDDNDADPATAAAAAARHYFDRYALTIWLPDLDPKHNIQAADSKFKSLRLDAFKNNHTDGGSNAGGNWC